MIAALDSTASVIWLGDITFDHGSGVGGYKQPQQRHSHQSDERGKDPDPGGELLIFHKSHNSFLPLGNFLRTALCQI